MAYPMPHVPTGYDSSRDGARRVSVGPMIAATDVVWALNSSSRRPDPTYVKAVFKSYVDIKVARGKTKPQISLKLEVLERELPQHAAEFRAVRAETGLPPSRVFPASRASSSNTLRRANTSQPSTPTRPGSGVTRVNTSAGVTTSRPADDDGELPPPPYASQDPEPESTRQLQERLAAEAEAAERLAPPLATPHTPIEATPVSPNTPYAPPTGPPPGRSAPRRRASSGPSRPSRPQVSTTSPSPPERRPESPDGPPSDEEVAKVWEESQFDEAKRASIAAEREREELEEAMHLSLVESESRGGNSAGPSPQTMPTVFEDEDDDGPSSRRISSYDPAPRAEGTAHRRIASDAGASGSMPGQWQGYPGGSGTSDQGAFGTTRTNGNNPDQWPTQPAASGSILDDEDNLANLPALTPSKTGAVLKSKNPFLSPQERQHINSEEQGSPSRSQLGVNTSSMHSPQRNAQRKDYGSMNQSSNGGSQQPVAPSFGSTTTSAYTPYSPKNKALPPEPSDELSGPSSGTPPALLRSPILPNTAPNLPPRSTSSATTAHRITSESSRPLPRPPNNGSGIGSGKLANLMDGEDPLEMLKQFDTVFLVDDSASMTGERWEQARNALMGVAEIAATYDEDGVDVYFLNSKRVGLKLKAGHDVEDLFSGLVPRGSSPTGSRLDSILRDYLSRLERSVLSSSATETPGRELVKPLNLIVITDGSFAHSATLRMRNMSINQSSSDVPPTDDPKSVLIAVAKRLDRGDFPLSQVGIQFLQIGNDGEAREALQELDDGLASTNDVRDMVDTVLFRGEPMSAGLIIKTLLGGINRRLDRRNVA